VVAVKFSLNEKWQTVHSLQRTMKCAVEHKVYLNITTLLIRIDNFLIT
jgi:hypothetical protein